MTTEQLETIANRAAEMMHISIWSPGYIIDELKKHKAEWRIQHVDHNVPVRCQMIAALLIAEFQHLIPGIT